MEAQQPFYPVRSVTSPLLGKYYLVPHTMEEEPGAEVCGYVVFADDPARLVRAIRPRREGWCDDKNRPFTKPIVAWYSMEKPDGTPLFG